MRVCPVHSKNCYPSKGAAIGAAIRNSKRRGVPLRVYWHHACGSHHLTKRPLFDTNSEQVAS